MKKYLYQYACIWIHIFKSRKRSLKLSVNHFFNSESHNCEPPVLLIIDCSLVQSVHINWPGGEKKGCVSIPVAHCFVWPCLFRCKSASKSVTSCQCMEGGTSGPPRRKLAWRDWDPRNVQDGEPYCSLGDIILSPSKSGHPGCYTSSAPLNTS